MSCQTWAGLGAERLGPGLGQGLNFRPVQGSYLQAVSQKHQTVLAKLELPYFIETAFVQASIVD